MKRTKFLPAVLAAALLMAGCNINTGTVQTVTRKYDNGDVYEGEWKDGIKSGQGTMTYADGTKESGQWENGKFVVISGSPISSFPR